MRDHQILNYQHFRSYSDFTVFEAIKYKKGNVHIFRIMAVNKLSLVSIESASIVV